MTNIWNASIRCVNNLPTNMKRQPHYAASVTWLTAKTHFYAEPLCGCAVFTYKRWCHRKCQGRGWHVCLSMCRHAAQVTEDCQLGAMLFFWIMVEPNFFYFDWHWKETVFCIYAKLWGKWDIWTPSSVGLPSVFCPSLIFLICHSVFLCTLCSFSP